jgi:hypothetical protein
MIKLSITKKSLDELNRQLIMKVNAIGYMKSPEFLEEISRAAFVILGQRFLANVDRYSATNRKRMHHIYEWNQVGNPNARLFVLNRKSLMNGNSIVLIGFKPSKTQVPIDPELQLPGKTGKSVTARNIFRDKARVMEEGISVSYRAKKMLAFMGNDGIKFIQPGTTVNIMNPGGRFTKNSLGTIMSAWYAKNSQPIMDSSGLYEKISYEASIVLSENNSDINDVRSLVSKVVHNITGGGLSIK